MKRLFTILAFVIAAMTLNAQGTIKNNSYFNLQYFQPRSHYGVEKDGTLVVGQENLHEAYKNLAWSETSRYAGGFAIGGNFYLHSLDWDVEWFKPGLEVDFIDLNAQYYRMKGKNDGDKTNMDLLVTYTVGVGPILTFSPAKDFYIDLYGKFAPTFGINYMKLTNGYSTKNANKETMLVPASSGMNDEETSFNYAFDFSAGFNLRYDLIQIGCEWNFGNMIYDYEDWSKQTLQNQFFKVKLGFSFE